MNVVLIGEDRKERKKKNVLNLPFMKHCMHVEVNRHHTHAYTDTHARTHARTHTHTYTHARTHKHTHTRTHTHARTHTDTHTHIKTHTHTHTSIDAHTHTHTRTRGAGGDTDSGKLGWK